MENKLTLQGLAELRESLSGSERAHKKRVRICMTGCRAFGAEEVRDAFIDVIVKRGLAKQIEIRETGCFGCCARAPVIAIDPQDIIYQYVSPDDVPIIVGRTLLVGKIIGRLTYSGSRTKEEAYHTYQVPFFKNQIRHVLANCGKIDPRKIEHYIARNGYAAIARVLSELPPEKVIETIEKSKLRGRGGAGFPTGLKWKTTRRAQGEDKYIVCNAYENDPDPLAGRTLLEGDPHSVLEGMLIAAYAIGARDGYIYANSEHPIAMKHLETAVAQAEEFGMLGENILGAKFDFHVKLIQGAGTLVCGEETTLLSSIEGKKGAPKPRPPFPSKSGLYKNPTLVNNAETFANIPLIALKGTDWFCELGTDESKGTKIISLSGEVYEKGLVEAPLGTSIRKVIFEIGGGIPKGRKFKAVQMGGLTGGCVPAGYLDTEIDFAPLRAIGADMGSGGMKVMDENTCMVDTARSSVDFKQSEPCRICAPCRIGTKRMHAILNRITQGMGREGDVEKLERIGETVKMSSLCEVGRTRADTVLSTTGFFREEYDAHIRNNRCVAGVCDALVVSSCQHTCPVGVDIPGFMACIAEGNYLEAVELIRERNPFPALCGRICHHPCEVKCRRGELDDPLAIHSLERFAADWYFNNVKETPRLFPETSDKLVAVVGAGPAGLSCAYHLAKRGYLVSVFEALPMAGGLPSIAIPKFRVPSAIIQNEVNYIQSRGVVINYNTPINENYTLEDLLSEGHAAIFIGTGAQKSRRVGIPGEIDGIRGLMYGLSFLRDVRMRREMRIGERVAVIGGGYTALNVSRTAIRLGAKKVDVFYRRSREEMPVSEEEYKDALDEGVEFHFLVSPTRIFNERWKVNGLECVKMKLGKTDAGGRQRPVPIRGAKFHVETDTLILSVGRAPDLSFIPRESVLERTRTETLDVDPNTLATNVAGVFAGGEFVSYPATLIDSIATGLRGAVSICKYLGRDTSGKDFRGEKKDVIRKDNSTGEKEAAFEKLRVKVSKLGIKKRLTSFVEVESGLIDRQARQEAKRCLRCDIER